MCLLSLNFLRGQNITGQGDSFLENCYLSAGSHLLTSLYDRSIQSACLISRYSGLSGKSRPKTSS